MLIAIDCPHHKTKETLNMPENFLGDSLCNPGDGGQAQLLRMKIANGKIQKLWGLPEEPPGYLTLEQQVEYWKTETGVYFDLWRAGIGG